MTFLKCQKRSDPRLLWGRKRVEICGFKSHFMQTLNSLSGDPSTFYSTEVNILIPLILWLKTNDSPISWSCSGVKCEPENVTAAWKHLLLRQKQMGNLLEAAFDNIIKAFNSKPLCARLKETLSMKSCVELSKRLPYTTHKM